MIWDTQAEPALTAIVAALALDDVGAVVCDAEGRIVWQNDAAGDGGERLAALSGQGSRMVRTDDGECRVSPLWAAEGALRLVRGPLIDRTPRLAAVLHDLRTPLQALSAAADEAAGTGDGKTARIGALAQNVLARLGDVLDGLDDQAAHPRDFSPQDIVDRMVALLAPLGRAGNVTVVVVPPERPVIVHGSPADFAGVVQNLLGNAIRHSRSRVDIALHLAEDAVALCVCDDGPGLPPAIERFLTTGAEPPSGQHLHGLRIVRDRLAALEGALQSVPRATGTELRAIVPARPADDALPEGTAVLVVEDNPVNAEIFAGIVRDMGAVPHVVLCAADIPAPLPGDVSAVLLDVSLPDISGLDVARRLRADHPFLPILGITGHAGAGMRDRCLKAGMSDVLIKPVRAAELRLTLSHLARAVPMIDEGHLRDMADDLGDDAARMFLRRALDESDALLARLVARRSGMESAVHSATGSAAMTGLVALERELRRIERALHHGPLPDTRRVRLAVILRRTRDAVERLGTSGG